MDDVSGIIGVLNFLGLTADKLVPLIILTLVLYVVFQKKVYNHLNPIKLAIVEIQSIFSTSGISIVQSLTEKSQSPLQPTEYGISLINNSGLGEILKNNMDKFLTELQKILKQSNNPYDVQEKARELLISKKDDKIMIDVKNYAFKNALSVETILKTGALLLRNEYLKKQKIPIE